MAKKDKKKRSVLAGTLQKHKNGFGFVDAGGEEDIFIPPDGMNGAMDGDVVEIDLLPPYMWDRRPEAIVTRVRERAVSEVIGTFYRRKNYGFVVPEGGRSADDIFIEKKHIGKASGGDKVVCEIIKYPDGREKPEGMIVEIIGRRGEPGGDITAMCRSYGVSMKFPNKALDEARAVSSIPVSKEIESTRRDLRQLTVFTIDGADAKDFDDAVSCSMNEKGNYVLGVHIADVSHYVKEKSSLDKEAASRGTSIYLPDRVIPMLPFELSNGICSLNPREDRLTLTCEMEIDSSGKVVRHDIYESVICSCERLVYEDVTAILEAGGDRNKEDENSRSYEGRRSEERADKDAAKGSWKTDEKKSAERLIKKYSHIYDDMMLMGELARILEKKRKSRGSIDFELEESEIILDDRGVPVFVGVSERGAANKMIEEFMLLANETVAEHFCHMQIPFVYRVHERPELEKMNELELFLSGFGIRMGARAGEVRPAHLADILRQIKGRPCENAVSTVMLRSMQKAAYDPECKGHFGLALRYYCHFTSPIRRYPDLMIHRIIKEHLHGRIDAKRAAQLERKTGSVADTSSFCERQALELERDVEKMKKAEYMSHHIGEEADGIISSVTTFGVFVQLENTVEGLVRYEDIGDDFYDFDEKHYCAVGRNFGRKFAIGDKMHVKVKTVDLESYEVYFVLI